MPCPLTVYKDGKSVSDVYPSELDAWLEQGWALEPSTEPVQPKQEPLVIVHDRNKELEGMGWRELKAIATEHGIKKTDNQSWEDLIPAILTAENR